ncbi:hypothetical protein BGZ63DRAFT_414828 [Mariannaea sp. PMI_226]|nr:hypothetical protein BGZ63DRAFT_414828 [Mariannaea sp. PMI_226]
MMGWIYLSFLLPACLLARPAGQSYGAWVTPTLWLYGLVGCGKTVLSTRIIDNLLQTDTHTTLFFFFDFNDPGKQTLESLLRSLAVSRLDRLFTSHDKGQRQLDISALSDYVKSIMQADGKIALVIDALDECITRKGLLDWLRDFASSHAQLIVTGRPEAEFQCEISCFLDEKNCILLDKKAVNLDIRSYVMARLKQDPDFARKSLSQDLRQKICDKVGDGADGIWATCQLDSLAKCLSPYDMEAAVGSLPSDLNETYSRMLQNIPIEFQSGAIRLLQFLVYAKRPMMLSEAVEVIATEIDREPRGFRKERRLFQETYVLKYCPSLVSIFQVASGTGITEELHLAHFSVKEYLLKQSQFSLGGASIVITRTSLMYLTDIKGDHNTMEIKFPMAKYAAEFWMNYAASAETSKDIVGSALRFLQNETTFQRWGRLHKAERVWESRGSRLYYACLGGLAGVARNIKAESGRYGNALQAASIGGHQEIVQLLMQRGANSIAANQKIQIHTSL